MLLAVKVAAIGIAAIVSAVGLYRAVVPNEQQRQPPNQPQRPQPPRYWPIHRGDPAHDVRDTIKPWHVAIGAFCGLIAIAVLPTIIAPLWRMGIAIPAMLFSAVFAALGSLVSWEAFLSLALYVSLAHFPAYGNLLQSWSLLAFALSLLLFKMVWAVLITFIPFLDTIGTTSEAGFVVRWIWIPICVILGSYGRLYAFYHIGSQLGNYAEQLNFKLMVEKVFWGLFLVFLVFCFSTTAPLIPTAYHGSDAKEPLVNPSVEMSDLKPLIAMLPSDLLSYEQNSPASEVYIHLSPLHLACIFGELKKAKSLIQSGLSPLRSARTWQLKDDFDIDIMSPLHLSIIYGRLNVVKWLCEKVLSNEGLQQHSGSGKSPVWLAAEFGQLEVLKYLHSRQISLESLALRIGGTSMTRILLRKGHLEVLKYIHDHTSIPVEDL